VAYWEATVQRQNHYPLNPIFLLSSAVIPPIAFDVAAAFLCKLAVLGMPRDNCVRGNRHIYGNHPEAPLRYGNNRPLAVMPILCQYPLTVRKSLKGLARNQHMRLLMEGLGW
jgi:hypothetical protein